MCSSTRGPAMAPSLVTWPTSRTAMPRSWRADQLACAAGAHLGDRAGRRLEGVAPHGLDRIDDHDVGRVALRAPATMSRTRGLGGELHRRVGQAQALGAQRGPARPPPRRRCRRRRALRAGERRRHLQQQGRLADAGIAADQERRARHQPAAADPVELVDAALVARRLRRRAGQAGELERRPSAAGAPAPPPAGPGAARGFLDDGVPLAAALAAAAPLAT